MKLQKVKSFFKTQGVKVLIFLVGAFTWLGYRKLKERRTKEFLERDLKMHKEKTKALTDANVVRVNSKATEKAIEDLQTQIEETQNEKPNDDSFDELADVWNSRVRDDREG